MIYFGANTFVPDYLHATNQAELLGAALTALNGGQVPASLVIGLVPLRLLARRATSYGVGAGPAGAGRRHDAAGRATGRRRGGLRFLRGVHPGPELRAAAPLLAEPADVARHVRWHIRHQLHDRVPGRLAGGRDWDATHIDASAFLPVLIAAMSSSRRSRRGLIRVATARS